ncbi:immunity 22 family protein [Rubinisphaera brasiliensis]|nr:immunity 22 family protein [Rubinisphaera brasiliensis]
MREEGWVSLWLGIAPDADALNEYIGLSYDDDGELIASSFMLDFSLLRWDEDFREAGRLEAASPSVAEVLSGFSYDSRLIEQYQQQLGRTLPAEVNAVVLLYNYRHQPTAVPQASGGVQLQFVGTAKL